MKKSEKIIGGIALAAVAGGHVFLTGKRGKNREKIASWTLKMKGEVLEKMKKLKTLNKGSLQRPGGRGSRPLRAGGARRRREWSTSRTRSRGAWSHISKQMVK